MSSTGPMPFPSIPEDGCSSATAVTVASRFSTRTGISWKNGKQFGGPSGIFIDANDNIYAADGESSMIPHPPDYEYGIKIGSIKDGKVKAFIPSFGRDHNPVSHVGRVVADSMGNLYVSSTYDGGARDEFPQILAAAEAAGTRTRNKNLTKFVKK